MSAASKMTNHPENSPQADFLKLQPLFKQAYNEGAYTTYVMLDYLVKQQAGMSYVDLMCNWRAIRGRITERGINQHELNKQLKPIWAYNSGRCTSFMLKTMQLAQTQYPGRYEWEIFRIGPHHLARCKKTGAVIDSSSRAGIDFLPVNEWKYIYKTKMWHQNQVSLVTRQNDKRPKQAIGPIKGKDALTFCLLGIREPLKAPKAICYFRSFMPEAREGQYHGMIEWKIDERLVEFIPTLSKPKIRYKICFGQGSNHSDVVDCTNFMGEFVRAYGGPHSKRQWELGGIVGIHQGLFRAAVESWGPPKLLRPEKRSRNQLSRR